AGARLNDGGKGSIDFAWGLGIQVQEVAPEFARRKLHVLLFNFDIRSFWIAQPGNGGRRRDQLVQQLQALWLQGSVSKAHAGDIAARPVEAGHDPACNGIAAGDEHDRYRRGGSPSRAHGDLLTDNHGYMPAHQVRHQFRESIELVLCPSELDRYVVAVDEIGFLQAVAERRYPIDGIDSRRRVENPDHRHRALLRARRERPSNRRAADEGDELAPPHSITSSARASSVAGNSRPSASAVCKLTTNSNFVGRS